MLLEMILRQPGFDFTLATPVQQSSSFPSDGRWLRTFRDEVQPATFKKGREYAETRHVSALAQTGDKVTATVSGAGEGTYKVELFQHDGKVQSHCSCQAWNRYGPHCKHVVAAALVYLAKNRQAAIKEAAERERESNAALAVEEAAAQASLLASEASEAAANPEAAPEVYEDGEAPEVPVAPTGDGMTPLPALAKLENWLGLSSLADLEFFYRITPNSVTNGQRTWIMDVRRKDAQAGGPVHVKRTLSAGTRLAPQDERIFHELGRHESRFDARMILNDEDLCDIFELLRTRKVIYRGTALNYMDEPVRPQIHLESTPDGAMARIEFRLPDGTGLGLREVILLAGRRSYVLHGQNLHTLDPDLPARLWRKWMLEPTMNFPVNQLDRALSFFAAHLPRLNLAFKADGIEVEEGVEPKFVLTLEGTIESVRVKIGARYGQTTLPVSATAMHLGYASGVGEGSRKLYRRNEESEKGAAKRLLELGFRFEPVSQSFDAIGDPAITFWSTGLDTLPKSWERFGLEALKVRVRPKLKPRIRVGMSGVQWFELESDFVSDDQMVDLGAVRMWLDSGRKFVPLKDGSFAEADPVELRRVADLLEEAGASPGRAVTKLPLHQAVALDLLASLGEITELDKKAKQAISELKETRTPPKVDAPEGLTATLRHYQEDGLAWLWFLERHGLSGILADDMGLGKTIQALSLLQKSKNEHGTKPSLVVAPTSVLPNWQREAEKFTPGLSVVLWHGSDRKDNVEKLRGVDVVLTSYALVRRDRDALSEIPFRYLILDEAQNIKNADSATAQACKSLPSDLRLALTGTPLENRLSELWSIFDFLMPGFLGAQDSFAERYETPIQVAGDVETRDRLRRRIQPFILRRLKTEVAKDLPPKTESVAYCDMTPGQAALYREVLEESRRKVYDSIEKVGFKRSRVSILAALMRLRQVCCDPRLLKLPPGTLLPPSAKLERFRELTTDLIAEGHRALVFSQFTEMLELLKQRADEEKIGYMYLDGRTKDRMSRVDQFNDPNGPPLFFISLKAGGTGLNLTAADYVIHYDPWWNPAVEDQATDRTHRIGQTKAVISYKLITRGTVEEKILALQRRKRELALGVLGPDSDVGGALTENDVEDLFKESVRENLE